jgi:hypothetical protein
LNRTSTKTGKAILQKTSNWKDEVSPSSSPNNLQPWVSAARSLLPWFIPAVLCVLMKLYLMTNGKGFRVIARYLGRVESADYTGLSFLERLTFFRSEILIELLLIPLVLLILFRYLPRLWRALLIASLSLGVSLVLYIQFRALEETGRYVSSELLRVALNWGIHDPGANKAYLLTKEFYAFIGCLTCLGMLLWRASSRHIVASPSTEPRWKVVGSAYAGSVALLTVLSWLPLLPTTGYDSNVLWRSLRAFWHDESADTREFTGRPIPELMERFRELTGMPVSKRDPRFFAKEKGANVLFFVLETTPSCFLPADDLLTDFPNLRRLQARSIVAENQYTTYPYTDRALFSLFSSWYPSDGIQTFGEQYPDLRLPGMLQALDDAGYATAMFAPSRWQGQEDVQVLAALGFQQLVIPTGSQVAPYVARDIQPRWKAIRAGQDLAALALLKVEIAQWFKERRPFAAVFVPQVGHLPWPDAVPVSEEGNILKRGRAVLAWQDAWLGEVLDLLEQTDQLENTVIVITGDHGIRTRREDPNFIGGTTDEYSYHVPFRLFAPKALDHPLRIPWLTSHIDVSPTVLDLLGIESGRDYEQGSPIWDPELSYRTTFLFGMQTFGADGYHSGERFFMWNRMWGIVYENTEPHFDLRDIVPRDSPDSQEVHSIISRMVGFQQAWVAAVGRGRSALTKASAEGR